NFTKVDGTSRGPEPCDGKPGRSIKVLVVDSHFLIREALRSVLKELNTHVIVMEATDGHQATQLISDHADIGLILLELNLPDQDGFAVLSEMRELRPATPVVVFSVRQDRESVTKALDLGAVGFIPKSGQREILPRALALVFAGGTYIPPEILM